MSIFRQIWKDLQQGENLDLYLNLVVAITLAILNLFGIGQSYSTSIMLAVLALLTVSNLVNRHKLESVLEKNSISKDILLNEFPPTFASDITNAKELWIIGVNLGTFMPKFYPLLKEKVRKDRFKLKVLVVHPEGAAYTITPKRANRPLTSEQNQSIILSTLNFLCSLKREFPSKVEIKTIDFPLPFGAFAIDLHQPNAAICMQYYLYKPENDMPKMVLHPQDNRWFNFYENQMATIWNDAQDWECQQTQQNAG